MFGRLAEWEKPKTLWLAWPYDKALWQKDLHPAQQEFLSLVDALKGQKLVVLFPNPEELSKQARHFGDHASLKVMPYGDIWLRDTLPIFVKSPQGENHAVIPVFNGWGKKHWFSDDKDLNIRVAQALDVPMVTTNLVFEGGAIECDGQGTLITTEQCLLNPNRNPGWSKEQVEQELMRLFGAQKIIWLKEGLKNDHTDGHVDTIARFIAPGRVAVMVPQSSEDPNYDALIAIRDQLCHEQDAQGQRLSIIELPSPGQVLNAEGELMPASFLNFIIGDEILVMPIYNTPWDDEALSIMRQETHQRVVAMPAKAILTGGGAFHCISQEFFI